MEITRMLTISTAHISRETAATLDFDDDTLAWECCISIYKKENYGWLIYASDAETEDPDMPDDLGACIRLARKNDCEWLCLDCDGEILETLPTYDW